MSGGGIVPGHYALLRYDGSAYPENPTVAPAEPLRQEAQEITVIAPFQSFKEGQLLTIGEVKP